MRAALEAHGLSKRYGRTWALRDCSLTLPEKTVVALVGPNGAGKTTLMQLAVGMLDPTGGEVRVFGWSPREQPLMVLSRIGFLAQDRPLYRGFTVDQTLGFGARLNPRWDDRLARERVRRLGIPFERKVGKLSGGQQAQVALTLALAKRPDMLLLDEPVAGLDPLARREFTQSLLEAAAEQGLTVVVSSHVVAELERFCDYLVVIGQGRIQVAGEVDGLVEQHRVLVGDGERTAELEGREWVVQVTRGPRQTQAVVQAAGARSGDGWETRAPTFEELVLAYMSNSDASTLPPPTLVAPQ